MKDIFGWSREISSRADAQDDRAGRTFVSDPRRFAAPNQNYRTNNITAPPNRRSPRRRSIQRRRSTPDGDTSGGASAMKSNGSISPTSQLPAPKPEIAIAALAAQQQSYEEFLADRWDVRRGQLLRIWRYGPHREIGGLAVLVACLCVLYSGYTSGYKIQQTSDDPPRWRIVPVMHSDTAHAAARVGLPAAMPRTIATPAPVDPLLPAKQALGTGEQMLAQNRLDEAVTAFREGLRLLPTGSGTSAIRIAVYNRMGFALGGASRFSDAINVFREATREFPNDSNLQNNLGVTLENAGGSANARAALEAFRAAQRLDPYNTQASDNVAAAERRVHNPVSSAGGSSNTAVQNAPGNQDGSRVHD